MSKKRKNDPKSSSAEYLTFIASGGESENTVEMRYEDENIWLTQKLMAELYDVSVPAINQHLKRLIADSEIDEDSAIKKFLITAADGKNYQTNHYNLQAIISVGFKVENERAVQNKLHYAIHGHERKSHSSPNGATYVSLGRSPRYQVTNHDQALKGRPKADEGRRPFRPPFQGYLFNGEHQPPTASPQADIGDTFGVFLRTFNSVASK